MGGTKMSEHQTILLVDDDKSFLEATSNVLESVGFRTIKASSPGECFDIVQKDLPDLVILDVMMARLDTGFEICRKLKHEARTKNIPILMLSAVDKKFPFDFKDSAGEADWLPSNDFLDKPVEASELIKHVKQLLEDKKST